MSDEKVLTKEIAEKFMEDDDSVDLSEFTAIEDQAAEVLSNYEEDLDLSQLLSISDVSTESLRSHRGRLALGCPRLSLHAGLHLADHRGPLEIDPSLFSDHRLHAVLSRHPSVCATPAMFDARSLLQGKDLNDHDSLDANLELMATATSFHLHDQEYYGVPINEGLELVRKVGGPLTAVYGAQLAPMFENDQNGDTYGQFKDKEFYFTGTIKDVRDRLRSLPNRKLTPTDAKAIVQSGEFDLKGFGEIEPEAMNILVEATDSLDLHLSELSEATAVHLAAHAGDLESVYLCEPGCPITKSVADLLGQLANLTLYFDVCDLAPDCLESLSRIPTLELGSSRCIWRLQESQASSLEQHVGSLGLSGVEEITTTVAKALAKSNGELSLDDLKTLNADVASALSSHRGSLYLYGIEAMSDAVVAKLFSGDNRLQLDDVSEQSSVCDHLVSNSGTITLNGLRHLTDSGAEIMCGYTGHLGLDLDNLPESAAAILRNHPSFSDQD